MGRLLFNFIIALGLAAALHAPSLDLPMGGLDRLRLAVGHDLPADLASAPMAAPSALAPSLKHRITAPYLAFCRALCARDARGPAILGMVLAAILATVFGSVVRRLAGGDADSEAGASRIVGPAATIAVLALVANIDLAPSPIGHIHLGGAILIALAVLGLGRRSRRAAVLGLALGLIALAWLGRDVGRDALAAEPATIGIFSRLIQSVAPMPAVGPAWRVAVLRMLLAFLPLTILALAGRRAGALPLVGAALVAAGAVLGVQIQPVPCIGIDARTGLLSGLGLAIMATAALPRLPKSSNRELAGWAAFILWIGSSVLAGRAVRDLTRAETDLGEVDAVAAELTRIPTHVEEIFVTGIRPGGSKTAPIAFLTAAVLESGRRPSPSLRTLVEGRFSDLRGDLLVPGKRNLIASWRPASLAALASRPRGWTLVPLIGIEASALDGRLELVAPPPEARLSTAPPKSLEEDVTFIWKIRPGSDLHTDDRFVFYGLYDGPWSPGGQASVAARPLAESVLERTLQADGSLDVKWRTSIRPGPGAEGLPFDDSDLGIAGRTFWWTVGIVHGASSTDEHDHKHASGGQPPADADAKNPADPHFPESVAQFRRATFQ